jgi:hypothetical protein
MAGIQELSDLAVMAFAHRPSPTEDRLFLARAEHAPSRTDAAKAAAGRPRPRPARTTGTAQERAEVELLAAEVNAAVAPGQVMAGLLDVPPSAASTALGCDRFPHAGHGSLYLGYAAIGA